MKQETIIKNVNAWLERNAEDWGHIDAESWVEEHTQDCDTDPAVWCGTYAKYNAYEMDGEWINVASFLDADEFFSFCSALHADEEDPEFMFNYHQNFPERYYSESMSEDDFDELREYIDFMADHDADAVEAFLCLASSGTDLSEFDDRYLGEYDSLEDYAEMVFDEVYYDCPENLRRYIDMEAFASDLETDGYQWEDGYVFDFTY